MEPCSILGWRPAKFTVNASAPLALKELVGIGNDRECWRHPLNRSLCIKVAKPEQQREQNGIDFHYGQHLARRKVTGPHLTRIHGWVQTDRGPGLIFDLVHEPDGSPSPSLSHSLRTGRISHAEAITLVNQAFDWLVAHRVVLADYGNGNLLVQQSANGTRQLVFVDGLGARNFGFQYWARRTFGFKARKKVNEFRLKALSLIEHETIVLAPHLERLAS